MYHSSMFVVVRHTYVITKDDPNPSFHEFTGTWKHFGFLAETNEIAMDLAKTFLDDPMLCGVGGYVKENAIQQLKDNGYYQVGGESLAIAELIDPKTLEEEEDESEEFIH
jgi:hypothetical protein|tara:strand:+ start:110 stop:439 length:330 start_codon:yes stop_codon:yes gene_type:complete